MLQIGNWTFPEKDQDCFWGGVLRLQKQVKQVFAGEMGNWKFGIEDEFLLVWTEEQAKTETMRAALREAAEKVLDFLTVRQVEYNALKEPEWNWMFFYRESGKTTVEMYDRTVLEMTVTCEVSVIPKTGMAKAEMEIGIEDSEEKEISGGLRYDEKQWKLLARYYRFAAMSSNLYDAYRWMYLVLEQLLQWMTPVKKNAKGKVAEKEGEWLRRALGQAGEEAGIFEEGKDTQEKNLEQRVEYFLKYQYKETRCRLFHSKDRIPVLNTQIEGVLLKRRYEELKSICIKLMNHAGILRNPYGFVTDAGFQNMILGTLGEKKEGYFSGQETFCQSEVQGKESGGGEAVLFWECERTVKTTETYRSFGITDPEDGSLLASGDFFLPVTLSGSFCLSVSLIVQMRNKGEYGQFG